MIYTVGLAESYDECLAEVARGERGPVRKVGRASARTGWAPPEYDGGSVWQTVEEALRHRDTMPNGELYGIYEVDADWRWHTVRSKVEGASYRALRYDRPITRRVDR